MGELASLVRKHPEFIGIAVVGVALLAWMQSRGNSGSGSVESDGVTFTGGGVAPMPVDPGVVQIDQARIDAGSRNIGTLASLLLGKQQSTDALSAVDIQTSAALRSDLARTDAQLRSSLAETAANEQVALTGISAQTTAAQITADTQKVITAANVTMAGYERDTENFRTQAGKDIARAQDNTDIVNKVIGTVGDVAKGAIHILSFGLF